MLAATRINDINEDNPNSSILCVGLIMSPTSMDQVTATHNLYLFSEFLCL